MIKVVMVAPGPFHHGPYCSSCSPAAGWSGLGRFQQGDNLSLETAQTRSLSPLAGVWTSIAQGRGHGAGCGAEVRDGRQHHRRWSNTKLGSSVTGETVAALTRHDSHPCSGPGCAPAITNYHSTFGDVDDRPGTHPLHHFGQPGVDWSKTPVRLCETRETRETRDRAQSTAHH